MKCLGIDLRVPCITISNKKVENFVRSLEIGHLIKSLIRQVFLEL